MQNNPVQSYSKVVLFAIGFVILGGIFYKYIEDLSWLDAFYFTVITLSTVGYGDIVPTTPAGKLFTIFYVFVGIVIFIFLARVVVMEMLRIHHGGKKKK